LAADRLRLRQSERLTVASAQAYGAVRCFYAALNAHDFRAMVAWSARPR